jgi:hypothetical protein
MTVRCSYCYEYGHNKRGCPEHKKRIDEIRANNPDDYRVLSYDAKKAAVSRKSNNAKCSWCGNTGHDRRRCGDFADARSKAKTLQADLRVWFKQICEDNKIGIGNILTLSSRQEESTPAMQMIDKINLNLVGISGKDCYSDDWSSAFHYKSLTPDKHYYGGPDAVSLRRMIFKLPNSWRPDVQRIPAAANSRGADVFPVDWLTGETGLDELFKPTSSRYGLRGYTFDNHYNSWSHNVDSFKASYDRDLANYEKVCP